jgi:hypothetical protein
MSSNKSLKRTNSTVDCDLDNEKYQNYSNDCKKRKYDNEEDMNGINIKLNAIYLLLKNINQNIENNNNEITNIKTDISSLYLQIKNIKGLNKNINCLNNSVDKIVSNISNIEDNILQTNLLNEDIIINNIKKLSLQVNNEKESKSTIDYRDSYIN